MRMDMTFRFKNGVFNGIMNKWKQICLSKIK